MLWSHLIFDQKPFFGVIFFQTTQTRKRKKDNKSSVIVFSFRSSVSSESIFSSTKDLTSYKLPPICENIYIDDREKKKEEEALFCWVSWAFSVLISSHLDLDFIHSSSVITRKKKKNRTKIYSVQFRIIHSRSRYCFSSLEQKPKHSASSFGDALKRRPPCFEL